MNNEDKRNRSNKSKRKKERGPPETIYLRRLQNGKAEVILDCDKEIIKQKKKSNLFLKEGKMIFQEYTRLLKRKSTAKNNRNY